jgi:2-succinyl-5-enolpyruvyl-6-hydroxy-3-cyclohexene-1-carboxylate synthase
MAPAVTVQATFAATLVDEWARNGVTDAVVCPGSRSTPLALALVADGRLRVHVHHDERAGGFVALGIGSATGRPALVVTTSGTAAVELHPAVVEASEAGVPLIACTADRPAELWHVGAPQTVDQTHLYGGAVRWFAEPGVADDGNRSSWRSLAARAVAEATGARPGPVHLNLSFREPLVGEPDALPLGRPDGGAWHRSGTDRRASAEPSLAALGRPRGLIVAGGGIDDPYGVVALAEATGWPVLADPRSGCRRPGPATVAAFDAVLRHAPFADRHRPDVVLRLGSPPASRVLSTWLAGLDAHQVAVDVAGAWFDPDRTAAEVMAAEPGSWCAAAADGLAGSSIDRAWAEAWMAAEASAQQAFDMVLDRHPEPTEPGIARTVVQECPDGSTLVVASSMPVRDVEWYAAPRRHLNVRSNRGANGIDGVMSTAVGVALGSGSPVTALVGDVAFLHDSNALLGLRDRNVDLTIVVVDNRGGGIFSFLPQAREVDHDRFELLFGTPHDVDLAALVSAHGLVARTVRSAGELSAALAAAWSTSGPQVVLASTDRVANVAVHDELHAAVAAALDG